MMRTTLLLIILFSLLSLSCNNSALNNIDNKGQDEAKKGGSVIVNFDPSPYKSISRTVVADFATQITKWSVTLSRTDYTTQTKEATNGKASFTDLEPGEWSVSVAGVTGSGVAASGSSKIMINEGVTSDCTVDITFGQSGKGRISFSVKFPALTGIDGLAADLYRYGENNPINSWLSSDTVITTDSEGNSSSILSKSELQSGQYELIMTFLRGNKPAGTFCEGVNIWDNTLSDRWLDSSGSFKDSRVFAASDFFDANASLGNLKLTTALDTERGGNFNFGSANYAYKVYVNSDTVRFIPSQSIDGQTISYSYTGSSFNCVSGRESVISLAEGTSSFIITVTAPDRATKKDYTVKVVRVYDISYTLNGGTNVSANPATYTNEDNTITFNNASRTGYTFLGWFTESGFTNQISTISAGSTGDKSLYAKWIENGNITITFNTNPVYQSLNFSQSVIYLPKSATANISTANVNLITLSGWKWYINGILENTQTSSTFSFSQSEPASFTISVSVKYNGILFSGSFKVIVYAMEEVTNLNAISGDGSVVLNWESESALPTFSGVEVYVDNNTSPSATLAKGLNTVTIGGLTNGTQYRFTVKSLFSSTHKSAGVTLISTPLDLTASGVLISVPAANNITLQGKTVSISAFSIGKYEVTLKMCKSLYDWNTTYNKGYSLYRTSGSNSNKPVCYVRWRDCIVWCNAYSEMNGLTPVYYTDSNHTNTLKSFTENTSFDTTQGTIDNPFVNWNANGYRLPTEAEWEYAARGGNTTAAEWNYIYAGSDNADEVAWYNIQSKGNQDAGCKKPNSLGLYDMSGNVFEFLYDAWSGSSVSWMNNTTDPYYNPTSSYPNWKTWRGGSYYETNADSCKIGSHNPRDPFITGSDTGFRVVRRP